MSPLLRSAFRRLGAHHVWRRRNRGRLVICCYHGLRADDDPTRHWLLVPQRKFVAQMEYLQRYYRCMSLDDALAEMSRSGLNEPTACVTFDDGYLSNRSLAQPILERLGIPATVYVATGFIGRDEPLWTTWLEFALQQSEPAEIDLSEWRLGVIKVGPASARDARQVINRLKKFPAETRRGVLSSLGRRLATPRVPEAFRFMDWNDVDALQTTGIFSIGAHTIGHEILSRLTDAEVRTEIRGSIDEVRRRASRPTLTFAYPNGGSDDFDPRARSALMDAGCPYAVSTIEGLNDSSTDRFALRRVVLGGFDDLDAFQLRMAGVLPAARN